MQRFYIDHDMIHDRVTGKHVTTDETNFDITGVSNTKETCSLLNSLIEQPIEKCGSCGLPLTDGECIYKTHGPLPERESVSPTLITYIKDRLKQHTDNYGLWENGFLSPTEPDEEERGCVMRELEACIVELRGLLAQPFMRVDK